MGRRHRSRCRGYANREVRGAMTMRDRRALAFVIGLVFIGFAVAKLLQPLDKGHLSIGALEVEAGSTFGRAFQYVVAVLELAIGAALLNPSTRGIGAKAAAAFGIACALGSMSEFLMGHQH